MSAEIVSVTDDGRPEKAELRFAYIQENAKFAEGLDI